ncbi:MAG: TolC family protein [Duganella sp.]
MQSRPIVLGAAVLLAQLLTMTAPAGAQNKPYSAAAAPSGAAVAAPLTLEQAITMALATSPELRSAAQSVAIAEGATLQAGALPNPEFSFLREGMQKASRTQTYQLSQALELGGKRGARIAVADYDRALAVGDVAVGRAGLRADVITAYMEALTAQERVDLARASLKLAANASNAAARRVTAGKISPLEQTRSNVAESSAKLELSQALSELTLAYRSLTVLWGSTAALDRALVMPDIERVQVPALETLQAQLDASPQMQRARTQIAREEAQVKLERAQRIPDLTVTVGSKKDYETGRSQTVVGLAVPLPLFNRNQGNLLSALRRVDKAKTEVEVEQLRLSQALFSAHQRAELSQQQITAMRQEILPAAQQAFDAAVTGFELGKFGFIDVLDAQRTLFQNRALYLRALSDRYRSIADLQRYVAAEGNSGTLTTDRNTQ